ASEKLEHRERPSSPAYFTGQPVYSDLMANLDLLYANARQQVASGAASSAAATGAPADVAGASWLSRQRMGQYLGVDLTTTQHRRLTEKLNRVWRLPNLIERAPWAISELEGFRRTETETSTHTGAHELDRFGRAYAYGWRKEASARVWMVEAAEPGTGEVRINGKPLAEYFISMQDRESVVKPLTATDHLGRYNVWCLVNGGGTTGQAEAMRLAVARALLVHHPEIKPVLRKAGLISHDARVVERKKPGQPKARKKYTW
ncbi:ribosomal protein S5 domain 2-type protein, partial [Thamnocephalis sphaerospora]